jgi:hypothetical protein
MADDLEILYEDNSTRPRKEIIIELTRNSNVDSLTQCKMKLIEKARQFSGFPKGEPYLRRQPKGRSNFATLEERLASDICELHQFFDTQMITTEVKGMFRGVSQNEESIRIFDEDVCMNDVVGSPARLNMTPDMRSQISSLQASFMLFRDKCMDDISSLQAKVLKLECVVDEQNREILSFRENCERNLPDGHQNELVSNELGQTNTADTELLPSTMENEDLVNGHQNEIASNELAQTNTADTELLPPTMQNEDLTVNADAISSQQSQLMKSATYASKLAATKSPKKNVCVNKTIVSVPMQNFSQEETEPQEEIFIGVQRKRNNTRAFFLSGINQKVSEKEIQDYLHKRNVIPTLLKIFPSQRKGTVSAKINVPAAASSQVTQSDFWPKFVHCRKWVPKSKLEKTKPLKQGKDYSTFV